MRTRWIGVGLVVSGLVVWGCGGGAALGEACDEEGAEGECEDGAVCGKPDDSSVLECLKTCIEQTDCPADQECNGISGSDIKACRPK
ncbi:hypothetical protein SOCEGT47_028050 [Sorangium cellulosum]|uniref:Uncharacterized protein n=1 Tax=Sorangium cellulosum TaxID=56 RepID=A0A4P2PZF8_SORCE|nr:hypothetical protein [Sorangium cellulosum]AUX22304.1 hypothetical protein SOCEGT47_028050 [Sorangium cellulosum]